MEETVIKTFNANASYYIQNSCGGYNSSIKISITNFGNINIDAIVNYNGGGGNTSSHNIKYEKITDNIPIPESYYPLIQILIEGFGGENRDFGGNATNTYVIPALKKIKEQIKEQVKEQVKTQNKTKQLEEQITRYEKIKLVTTQDNKYLDKYYELTNEELDQIVKLNKSSDNSKDILREKLNKYKEERI